MKRSPIRKVRRKPRPGRLKGKDLEKLRRDCFERDHYQCQHELRRPICDLKGYVVGSYYVCCGNFVTWESGHMAHVVSKARGGKDELANVLTKCERCHLTLEHSYGPSGEKPCPKKS